MNDLILSSGVFLAVFLVGYLFIEKVIPKTKKSLLAAAAIFVFSGVIVLLLFQQFIAAKAASWGLIWLGVITINRHRKLKNV